VATPIATLQRSSSKNRGADHRSIAELVAEWEAEIVAVGLPLSLDGSIGPAAEGVLAEVAELAQVLAVPVETVDERFTTVTADQQLKASGVRGRDRSKVIDQTAAAVLLQVWLDGREKERC
jgi:putative Holliday junction resolvase